MSVNNTHAEKQTRHTISSQHTSHVFFTQWMDYGFNLFRCISIFSFIHPLVPFFLTPNVCLSVCRSVKTNSSELLERQRWARSQTNRSSTCIWSKLSLFLVSQPEFEFATIEFYNPNTSQNTQVSLI